MLKTECPNATTTTLEDNRSIAQPEKEEPFYKSLSLQGLLDPVTKSSPNINLKEATAILISLSFGSAVIILPHTVLQLGPITWVIFTALIITLLAYALQLMNELCLYMFKNVETSSVIRDPIPTIAEMAWGSKFRIVVTILLYCSVVSTSIAFMLLSATVLRDVIPLQDYAYYAQVRIWTVICVIVVCPLMYKGAFSDLKGTACLAVVTSSTALVCIIVLSLIARFDLNISADEFLSNGPAPKEDFISTFGLITFAAAGTAMSLPNTVIFVSKPNRMSASIICTYVLTFIIYIVAGIIPYAVFGEDVQLSITTTISGIKVTEISFHALLIIAQLAISGHLLLAAVIFANPIYQLLEKTFDVPAELSWKRIVVRTCGVMVILCICLLVPYFQHVLSIAGGVPLTSLCIIFPLISYMKLFTMSLYKKALLSSLVTVSVLFMIATFIVGVKNIVKIMIENDFR